MKKSLLTLAMAALSVVAMAQKGSWYIGGLAGFASTTSKPPSGTGEQVSTSWAFAPEAGTFLMDDIQLGLALGIGGMSNKVDGNLTGKGTVISPTAYGRKFFKITDSFSTFAGLYLNYTKATGTAYTPTAQIETTDSGFGVRLGVGVAYALSPRFTAVGQYGLLGFQSSSTKQGAIDQGSVTRFDLGVNTVGSSTLSQGNNSGAVFNIGLYYTFKP